MTALRRPRMSGVVVAVALVAVVMGAGLAGCSNRRRPATLPPPSSTVAPPVTVPATTTTTTPPAVAVVWAPCSGHAGWDCGTLAVPLDHAHPGRTIDLALSRHKATNPARRKGSLLINPGGPGESGISFAFAALDAILDQSLAQDFDVIGFDPRGVGESTPVQCADGPTLDRLGHLDPDPTTPASVAALVAGAKELAAGCKAMSGDLLAHVSTVDAARDLEDIRMALGDPGLSYLGFSYGTLLGATYASLFPTHVRALVLDSAIDPAIGEEAMSLAQAIGFENNLNAFLADCAARACAFQRHGAASLRSAFDALVARIRSHPIPSGNGRTLGPGEALFGIATPLYDQVEWPALATGLEEAEGGNGSTLLRFFDTYTGRKGDGSYDNSLAANVAVNCLDHPVSGGVPAFDAAAKQARMQAPYFGGPVAWGALTCAFWPVPSAAVPGPLHAPGAPPIVVVGSTGDPATPYEWAVHLASELGSGDLVTRRGEGHGAYPASACVRTAVDAYLETLVVPAPNLVCSS